MSPHRCLLLVALLLCCGAALHAQPYDRRAVPDIRGGVSELSVSPDGRLWLVTSLGRWYGADGPDWRWHSYRQHPSAVEHHLERVSFFNRDTALTTGFIAVDTLASEQRYNGYYRTTDGGATWTLMNYGGNSWIFDACTNASGDAWLGCSGKALCYSPDYGLTWATLKMPWKASDRIYSIFMTDRAHGLAGSERNELAATTDNWKTVTYLPTPLDQQRYRDEDQFPDTRISKVRSWGDYLAVQQHDQAFYTRKDRIDWKSFPYPVTDFEVCADRPDELWVVGDSVQVFRISDPAGRPVAYPHPGLRSCDHIRSVGNALYLLGYDEEYEVARVDADGATMVLPYTTDYPIDTPGTVVQAGVRRWGTDGRHLYLADGASQGWYLESRLPCYADDIRLLSDSVALIWDGRGTNYAYSLHDHAATPYEPPHPLRDFLSSPVHAVRIEGGRGACFYHESTTLDYTRQPDGNLACTQMIREGGEDNDSALAVPVRRTIPAAGVATLLARLDQSPGTLPSVRDFGVRRADVRHYRRLLRHLRKNEEARDLAGLTGADLARLRRAHLRFDTLSDATLADILHDQQENWSTRWSWLEVDFINGQHDTLRAYGRHFGGSRTWHLAWQVEWRDARFYSYDPAFTQFVNRSVSGRFTDKAAFDKRYLLLDVAMYLARRKP